MTNRITGKLIPKDNRNVQFYADFFPDGDIGSSGGGTTSGIPTIDKNIQPNIVWREPTAEDLAKFYSQDIIKVADLTEGKLPLFLIMKNTYEDEEYIEMNSVLSVIPPNVDAQEDGQVSTSGSVIVLADDWSMIGKVGLS